MSFPDSCDPFGFCELEDDRCGFCLGHLFSNEESLVFLVGLVCLVVWVSDPFLPVANPAHGACHEFSLVV